MTEDRFITVGQSSQGRLLVVSHTEKVNAIRIRRGRDMKIKAIEELRPEYEFDYSKTVRGSTSND